MQLSGHRYEGRFDTVALSIIRRHELHDDLRIGFRLEGVPLLLQNGFQGQVILNDPVMDNGKTAISTAMRVRVGLTDTPMRGPAGVGNAY